MPCIVCPPDYSKFILILILGWSLEFGILEHSLILVYYNILQLLQQLFHIVDTILNLATSLKISSIKTCQLVSDLQYYDLLTKKLCLSSLF